MTDLIITSPLAGWAARLEEVSDPVFAERMMGDGIAIHPTGSTVYAPCDGVVATCHAAGHALTIRHAGGAEILVHVGLDTVALNGRGFHPRVAVGATVERGDPLLDFDLDEIAQAATSVVTPLVVVNSEAFRVMHRSVDAIVAAGDPVLTLQQIATDTRADAESHPAGHERTLVVPLPQGLHARPAARIGACARQFDAQVEIVHGTRRVNARSTVALMALGLQKGDGITVCATGREARAAVDAVSDLIAGGMGESSHAARDDVILRPLAPHHKPPAGAVAGVIGAPGLAIGPAWWAKSEAPVVARDAADAAAEQVALDAALAVVRARVAAAADSGSDAQRHILAAHLAFLEDEELVASARADISAGRSAGFAWSQAIAAQTAVLRQSGDARFAERASDLADIERQILFALSGSDLPEERAPRGAILLAGDVLPSQLAALEPGAIAGIVLGRGGPTSHVAIMAASAGLPMLVATGHSLDRVANGAMLALDADNGFVHVSPDADALATYRERRDRIAARKTEALAAAHEACRSADGSRIEVHANVGSVADAAMAASQGAEGSGLVRTEFLFLDRRDPPDEDEQHATYQAIVTALAGRPVIVRLLDIGGDKPAPYLPLGREANPMLGQRGIRATLAHPALLDTQLRAILRVQPLGQCRIMVPMITNPQELRAVRAAADHAAVSLGIQMAAQVGAMIETPAAAVTADLIAREADFLSIGTNDLTQYTLAMDRENAAIAAQVDALHPAVLRLIAQSCDAAARHDRPIGVCGGLASDPLGIPLLLGLGVTELSVTPAAVPDAKAMVRRLDLDACRALAAKGCELESADEVRALVRAFMEELD